MSLNKNINPSLVLVQPSKTLPFITESLLMGHKESDQTNKQKIYKCYYNLNHSGLSFFLSIYTGSHIHEHYTRECEFGNFDKIKNKKKHTKNKTTQKKHKNFWLNFCLIRSALNSSVDWVFATEGGRLFECGIVQGKKEFFRHHCMSGVCGIEHYVMTW